MGSAASLPNARPDLWTIDDVKAQAEFFIQRDGYLEQIERKKVDGSKLSRLNPRLFKKLGFERIGWPSCGSVTGELRRIYQMYGEQSDDSEAADDEEVSETVLLKLDPQFTSPAVWTVDHVCSRLEAWGFGTYAKAFRHARIDGLSLLRMLKCDIEYLGVRPKLAPCLLLEILSACQGVPAEAVMRNEMQPSTDTFDVERVTAHTALSTTGAGDVDIGCGHKEADQSSNAGQGDDVLCDAFTSERNDIQDEDANHTLSQGLEPESVVDLANVLLQCHIDGVQRNAAPHNDNEDGDFRGADQAEPATHERRVKEGKSRTDGITWHGTERNIHELMKDLQRGNSTLRLVAVPPPEGEAEPEAVLLHERQYVEVEFWYESDTMGPYVLVETHTQLGNGKFKSCFEPIRGLVIKGESWKTAAQRAVCDDLLSGVGVPSCEWLSSFLRTGVECFERAETPFFPGLRTRYTVHSVRAVVRTVAEEYLDYWSALAFEGDGSQITATHQHGAPGVAGNRVNSGVLNADIDGKVSAEHNIAGPDNALHRSTHLWTWYSDLQWGVICAKRAGMLGEQHMLKALKRRRGSRFQNELPLKWSISRGILDGHNSANVSVDQDGFGGTMAFTRDNFGVGDVVARKQVAGELFDALRDVQCRCLLVNAKGSILLLGQGTSLMSGLNEDIQIAKLCSPEEAQNEIDGHREMRSLLGHTCADLVAGPVLSKCGKVAGVKYALEGACWHQPEFAGQHAPMLYTAADIFRWQVNFNELPLEAKLAAVEDPEATFMNVLQQIENSLLARGTLASAARMRASKREGLVLYHKCKEAIRLHLHANGEGDYVRDSAGDWVWRPDYSPHSLLLAEPLDEVAKTEFDLLERAVDHRARRELEWVQGWQPMFGKVHGALNADTIIVDHTETLWLVDFSKVHHGHIWSDVAHLETSFLFRYLVLPVCVEDVNTLPRDELCAVLRISQITATALDAWRSRPVPEQQKRRKGQSKATRQLQMFTQKKWIDQCDEILSEAKQNAKTLEHLQQIECDHENLKCNVVATEDDSSAVLTEACRVVDRLAGVFDLSHPLDPNELDLDIPRVRRAWHAIVALRNCMPRLCAPSQPTARLIQPVYDLDRHPINLVMPCFVASLSMLAEFGLSRYQKRFALFAARRYAQRLTEWLAMPHLHAPHSEQFPVPPHLIYEAGHRVRVFHSAPTEGTHKKRWIDGVVTKAPSDRSGAHTLRFTSLIKSSDPDAQDPWAEETHTADFYLDCTSHSTAAVLRFEPGLRLWVQISGKMQAGTIVRGASNSNDHIVRLDCAISDGNEGGGRDIVFNMAVHNHSLDPNPPMPLQDVSESSKTTKPPEVPTRTSQSSATAYDHVNECRVDNWATRASQRLHSSALPPLQGQEHDRLARGIMFDVVAKDAAFGATVKIMAIEVHVTGRLPLTLYACEGGVERNFRNADEWKIVSATDGAKCEAQYRHNEWPYVKMVLDPPLVIEGGACVGLCVHCPAGVYGAAQAIRYRAIPVKVDEDGLEEEIRPMCEDDRVQLLPGAVVERKQEEELHDEGEVEERIVDQEALALMPQPFPEMFEASNNNRPMMHFIEFLGTVEYEYSDEEDGAKKATSVPRSLRTHDDAMFVRRAACGVIFMVDSKRVGISFESLVLRVGGVGLLPTVSVYTMIQEHVQVNKEFTASGQLNNASRINAVERPQRWTLLTERRPVSLDAAEHASISDHIAAAELANGAVQRLANGDVVQKRDMTSQLVRVSFERKYVVPANHTVYFIVHSPDRYDAVYFHPSAPHEHYSTVDQEDAACSLSSCAMLTHSMDVFDGELAEPVSSADEDDALSIGEGEGDMVLCESIDGALDAQSLCASAFLGAIEYDVAIWQPKFRKGQRLRLLCANDGEENLDNDQVSDDIVMSNDATDAFHLQWRGATLIEMHETDPARGKIRFEELSSQEVNTSNGQRMKQARQPTWWTFKPGNHVIEMINFCHFAAAENRLQNNLRCRHTFVADVLTGHGLDTLEQCMNVRLPAAVADAMEAEAQAKADHVAQQIRDAEAAAARDAERKALEDKVRASAAATGKATEVQQHDEHQHRKDEYERKQREALANEMQKSNSQAVCEAGTTGRVFAVIKHALMTNTSIEGQTSSGVLISGSAGAGKSMLLRRTLMHALKESNALGHVVPLLVSVADLSTKIEQEVADMQYLERQLVRAHRRGSGEDTDEEDSIELESEDVLSCDASGQLGDLLDIWCQRTFGLSSPIYHFIKQAQLERRLLLMLDGVDEAGSQCAVVEKYIADEVCCQAALVVATVTAQPKIEHRAWWARRFVHVSMAPLTCAQSRFVVAARLPAAARGPFLDFLKHTRHETDEMKVTNTKDHTGSEGGRGDAIHAKVEEYGENAATYAIVSHPLMLSMMVSVVQGSAAPTMPNGGDCWAQRRVQIFHTMVCALLFRFRSRCAMLTTSGFFQNLRSLVDKKSVFEKQLHAQGKGPKRNGRPRLGSIRRPSARSRMLIKERGQYGIQVSDLLAFFRHVAFITHEHGRLSFDEALLEELLDADAHFRPVWKEVRRFAIKGDMNLIVWCPKKAGISPSARCKAFDGVVEKWDGVDRGLFCFPHVDLQYYLASLEIMEQLSHTLRSQKKYESEVSEMQMQLECVERKIAEFEAQVTVEGSSFDMELQKQDKAARILKSNLDSLRTRVGIGKVNVEACDKQFRDGILHIKRLMLSKLGMDKPTLRFPSRWWQPVLQFCCDHVTEWERRVKQQRQEPTQHKSKQFMVADIARQVRYESLVTKNVAGGLEADDEKPSWRAALQYLVTEILPQEDKLPSYWEDTAIVGRSIGSTLRNIQGDAPSSDEEEYDTDEDDGRSHWFEDPQTAQVEGVLRYNQLDALAISTLFRLLDFQPKANALVLTGLTHSGLVVASRTLASNTTLLSLTLNGNPMGPRGMHLLAAAMSSNTALQRLLLRRTGACDYGDVEGLQALCEAVKVHPSLTALDLAECCIPPVGARIVALMLKGPVQDRVNGLRSLSLAHNPLVERDGIFAAGDLSGLQALLSTLVIGDAVQTLTALDLSHVSLGSDGLALVLAALNQGCAGGTPRAGTIMNGTLGNGNALSVLDLRDNGLGEKGAMALVETIVPLTRITAISGIPIERLRYGTLQSLQLRNTSIAVCECVLIASFLREHPECLRVLDLSFNAIGVLGMRYIASAIEVQHNICELLLAGTDIAGAAGGHAACSDAVVALAEALRKQKRASLRVLDLSQNLICGAYSLVQAELTGLEKLMRAIKRYDKLRALNLANNNLGCSGLVCVAEMVAGNHSLWSLNLSRNSLLNDAHDIGGFVALSNAIADNAVLTILDLSWNRLTGTSYCVKLDGVQKFAASLRQNSALEFLNFENNYVDLESEALLQHVCDQQNIALRVKNLSELG